MSHAYRNAWDDPHVKAALKQRDAAHVYLLCCGRCHNYGYYNEGSHFTCSVCDWHMRGEDLDCALDNGEAITLDDYVEMQVNGPDGP